MTKITLGAGRVILRDGQPFIAIQRLGDTPPGTADEMARHITEWIADHVEGGDHPQLLDTVLGRPKPQEHREWLAQQQQREAAAKHAPIRQERLTGRWMK